MKSLRFAGALTLVVGPAIVLSALAQESRAKGHLEALPSSVTNELHAIAHPNDADCVATGATRTVVCTADGGKTWKRVTWAPGEGCAVVRDEITASRIVRSTTHDGVVLQRPGLDR